jgi:arsenate reductase (thioredoxin)
MINVLFLCTGNTARSILAEAVLRQHGGTSFGAFSAGSFPKGAVNPLALEVLTESAYPTEGLRSKSWDEFATRSAPEISVVITVCDNAAAETCPIWPGAPLSAHWSLPDPQTRTDFEDLFKSLNVRIARMTALDFKDLPAAVLAQKLNEIGGGQDG